VGRIRADGGGGGRRARSGGQELPTTKKRACDTGAMIDDHASAWRVARRYTTVHE